ncbi:Dehydrogenases, short chain protein 2, isoform a, putative [Brugia malayi]|uniref:Bm4405, isoform b n=1 Tax=Brugia malayi TaxID=6279 RepID=A0A1P6CER0_BRUMA|nr:Dehydrogenases, short chain protein 2, isoform a, putative [Brugia malayi]CDQ05768.1 Bm4405, isoform b [Brugia malayi]VIO89768.1 Dehydrogenases, short chain protein 2, isoform a, putative [Brugia malayi]
MFLLVILFTVLPLLYVIYGLLGRKLTIGEIDKKAVLITGCGSGFGRDLVKRCLQNGLTVFAGCQFESNISELEKSYSSISKGRLYAFQMDVTDDESVRKSREIVDNVLREKNIVLHSVVNNAGIRGNQFYDDFLLLDDYKEVWEVNTYGAIRVTQAFRSLIKKSSGRIIICCSASTLFPAPTYGPYVSSKCALQAYANIIRYELEPYGVIVVVLFPGTFQTGLHVIQELHRMIDFLWNRSSQEIRNEYGNDFNVKAKAFANEMLSKFLSKDTAKVIDAYYEAIVARRPKLSYRIGWDTSLIFYPYSFMPLRVQCHLMKFLMNWFGAPVRKQPVRKQET